MRTTHAPTLRSLIERLWVDALRVAAEKKSWERRPIPGGYGSVVKTGQQWRLRTRVFHGRSPARTVRGIAPLRIEEIPEIAVSGGRDAPSFGCIRTRITSSFRSTCRDGKQGAKRSIDQGVNDDAPVCSTSSRH